MDKKTFMGQRQEYLNRILLEIDDSTYHPQVPHFQTSGFHNEIKKIYTSLGGILPQYPTRLGDFDIIRSRYIIELDEERHFNRYRERTLKSTIYNQSAWFDVQTYLSYSKYPIV